MRMGASGDDQAESLRCDRNGLTTGAEARPKPEDDRRGLSSPEETQWTTEGNARDDRGGTLPVLEPLTGSAPDRGSGLLALAASRTRRHDADPDALGASRDARPRGCQPSLRHRFSNLPLPVRRAPALPTREGAVSPHLHKDTPSAGPTGGSAHEANSDSREGRHLTPIRVPANWDLGGPKLWAYESGQRRGERVGVLPRIDLGDGQTAAAPGETELGGRFGVYIVGMFDILGQKRSLYELPEIRPPGAIQDEELLEYVRGTAGRVLRIRRLFDNQFRLALQSVEDIAGAQGATARQKQILTPSLRHWGMSDSYVVAIPPPDSQDFSAVSRLIDIFRMLDVAAAVWLLAMSEDLPIRGGIEVGLAIDVGEREVYGHALAEAVRLECKVAKYPRIVVGEGLLTLLSSAVKLPAQRSTEEASMAKNLVGLCGKCLRTDEDGQRVVDVGGAVSATQIREQIPNVLPAVARNVERQLKRHEDSGDTKLVMRYKWLQRTLAQFF